MRILEYLSVDTVALSSSRCTMEERITALTGLLARAGKVPDAHVLADAIMKRETVISTAMGEGVAIPHAKLEGIVSPCLAIGICSEGVDGATPDGKPIRVVFLIASCLKDDGTQLKILAALARYIKAPGFVAQMQACQSPQAILEVFTQFESSVRL